ncbi:MAG: hypothetical protein K5929_10115 [Lachnospiraceae bacterium]|nr:hypothetical protein [Lachnospiraceae bacterium]
MKTIIKKPYLLSAVAIILFVVLGVLNENTNVYADSQKWDEAVSYDANAKFSIDLSQKSGNGSYSIKIKNVDYGISRVEKTFKVKPNTTYRASVMAKCQDFNKSSNEKYDFGKFGAVLSMAQQMPQGSEYTGSKWKKLTYSFNSGDDGQCTLALYNAGNKGTVYFSDFKLEEIRKKSNEWNLCIVYVNKIKAPIVQNGEKTTFSEKFCKEDKDFCTETIKKLYSYVPFLSEERMDIKSIDFYECKKTVTSLSSPTGNSNYNISLSDKALKETLDTIILNAEESSGKLYDQIIVVSPLSTDLAGKLGVNIEYEGTPYDTTGTYHGIIQVFINHKEFRTTLLATFVHELLHSVEHNSSIIDPEHSPSVHGYEEEYADHYFAGKNGLQGNIAYFSDIMRKATFDGRGFDEKAFLTYGNSTRKTIYGSTEKNIYKKKDITKLSISEISDKTYTGKEIKPSVNIKNGKKTLKEGTDYNLSYSCNTDIGIASVIVTGKGKYFGSVKQNFRIIPAGTNPTYDLSGEKYYLTWKTSKGATGYEVFGSTNGKDYTLLKTVDASDSDSLNTVIDYTGEKYTFRIKAFTKLYPQIFYSE